MLSTRYTRIIAGRVEDSETRVCVGDTPLTYRIVWSGPGSAVSVPLRRVAISPPATRSIACSDIVRSTSSSPIPVCADGAFPAASKRGRYNFYFVPFRNFMLLFTTRLEFKARYYRVLSINTNITNLYKIILTIDQVRNYRMQLN